jgi:hypothetical protein
MENVMSAKNMFAALLLGAFMCVPVAMNADCGNKAKVECAKEASKEDGMACCKKKNSKEAKADKSSTSTDISQKSIAPKN